MKISKITEIKLSKKEKEAFKVVSHVLDKLASYCEKNKGSMISYYDHAEYERTFLRAIHMTIEHFGDKEFDLRFVEKE